MSTLCDALCSYQFLKLWISVFTSENYFICIFCLNRTKYPVNFVIFRCESIYMFVCLSTYLRSICLSICMPIYVCLPICLSFTSLNSLLSGKTHPHHLNSPDQLWSNNETPPVSAETLYAAVCGFHAVRAKLCAAFKCAVVSALMEHHSSHAAGQDEDAVLRGAFLPPRSNPGLVLSETHKCWEVTRMYRCK